MSTIDADGVDVALLDGALAHVALGGGDGAARGVGDEQRAALVRERGAGGRRARGAAGRRPCRRPRTRAVARRSATARRAASTIGPFSPSTGWPSASTRRRSASSWKRAAAGEALAVRRVDHEEAVARRARGRAGCRVGGSVPGAQVGRASAATGDRVAEQRREDALALEAVGRDVREVVRRDLLAALPVAERAGGAGQTVRHGGGGGRGTTAAGIRAREEGNRRTVTAEPGSARQDVAAVRLTHRSSFRARRRRPAVLAAAGESCRPAATLPVPIRRVPRACSGARSAPVPATAPTCPLRARPPRRSAAIALVLVPLLAALTPLVLPPWTFGLVVARIAAGELGPTIALLAVVLGAVALRLARGRRLRIALAAASVATIGLALVPGVTASIAAARAAAEVDALPAAGGARVVSDPPPDRAGCSARSRDCRRPRGGPSASCATRRPTARRSRCASGATHVAVRRAARPWWRRTAARGTTATRRRPRACTAGSRGTATPSSRSTTATAARPPPRADRRRATRPDARARLGERVGRGPGARRAVGPLVGGAPVDARGVGHGGARAGGPRARRRRLLRSVRPRARLRRPAVARPDRRAPRAARAPRRHAGRDARALPRRVAGDVRARGAAADAARLRRRAIIS